MTFKHFNIQGNYYIRFTYDGGLWAPVYFSVGGHGRLSPEICIRYKQLKELPQVCGGLIASTEDAPCFTSDCDIDNRILLCKEDEYALFRWERVESGHYGYKDTRVWEPAVWAKFRYSRMPEFTEHLDAILRHVRDRSLQYKPKSTDIWFRPRWGGNPHTRR